jgi:hypothetical protein
MSPGKKSNTAIVAGQIASALIGFALGVVVTLLAVVDWAPATARPAIPAPAAAPAPAVPAVPPPPVVAPPAAPASPPEEHAAAAPPPEPVPTPPAAVQLPPPPPAPPPAPVAAEPPAPTPVAKPPKPKPKPAAPSPTRARFVVQAGAFVNDEIAGKVAARLTDDDHQAEVLTRTDDSGRAWNVVRLTEVFPSRGEAERVANALKRDDDVDTLIIRLPPAKPEDAAKADAGKSADKPAAAEAPSP